MVMTYDDWFMHLTAEQTQLMELCYEYEELYFEDMTFRENSIAYDAVKVTNDMYDFIPTTLSCNDIMFFVGGLDADTSGQYDRKNKSITIADIDYKPSILHELIHFYIDNITDNINPCSCEYLLIKLYNKLSPQIANLDELIDKYADIFFLSEGVERTGGLHGVLFLLKSYDLDLRCGYELGTVFGYGGFAEDQ